MDNLTRSWRNDIAIGTNQRTAGSSVLEGPVVDLAGYNCAVLTVEFAAIAAGAVTSVKIQESDASASGFTDVPGSSQSVADDDDNKVVMIELTHPLKRYARAVVSRASANATVRTGRWLLGSAAYEPVDQPSDVITKLVH